MILINYRNSLKKKDIELLYREELFSVLSNNVDDVFLMIDADGNVVNYVSPNSERLLGLKEGKDSFEIFIDDNKNVILRKYIPGCIVCGDIENLKDVNGIKLCKNCIEKFNG